MRSSYRHTLVVAALAVLAAGCAPPRDRLPLIALAPRRMHPDAPLVLVLSGDGDWSLFPRTLGRKLVHAGIPVLGLRSRSYFWHRRTPAETAAALATATQAYLRRWHRRDIIVVGYSRGAEVAPFVLNRWPPELRARVRALALVAMSERASFEFRLHDLLGQVAHSDDLPTRPELERLLGLPMICIYGTAERDSFCARPLPRMRVFAHPGGHYIRLSGRVADTLIRALGLLRPGRRADG